MARTHQERLDRIEQYLREERYADLHTLAKRFGISLSTVRRALNELEQKGVVRRHHGGASLLENEAVKGYDFITQDDRNAEEKALIAEHVAAMIEPGMTVMFDGGTTTYAIARRVVGKRIIVITNSLPIAMLFSEVGSSEAVVTGGTVYARLGVLLGPNCESALAHMHADLAVLGGAGLTAEGFWNSNSLIIAAQKAQVRAADRTIFALDSSKFDKRALSLAFGFEPRLTLVTDKAPPAAIAAAMRAGGTGLEVAAPGR